MQRGTTCMFVCAIKLPTALTDTWFVVQGLDNISILREGERCFFQFENEHMTLKQRRPVQCRVKRTCRTSWDILWWAGLSERFTVQSGTARAQIPIVQPVGARLSRSHVQHGVAAETQRSKRLAILATYDLTVDPHKFAVIDSQWCCFYHVVRNSLAALLEALCAQFEMSFQILEFLPESNQGHRDRQSRTLSN